MPTLYQDLTDTFSEKDEDSELLSTTEMVLHAILLFIQQGLLTSTHFRTEDGQESPTYIHLFNQNGEIKDPDTQPEAAKIFYERASGAKAYKFSPVFHLPEDQMNSKWYPWRVLSNIWEPGKWQRYAPPVSLPLFYTPHRDKIV